MARWFWSCPETKRRDVSKHRKKYQSIYIYAYLRLNENCLPPIAKGSGVTILQRHFIAAAISGGQLFSLTVPSAVFT